LWMSPRIPRSEVLTMQAKSHLLLMVSHRDAKGIPSSKIYEYFGLRKPVLVCPGDGDVLDETFGPYALGFIANTSEDAFNILEQHFLSFLKGQDDLVNLDTSYAEQFTREQQTKVLAEILDKVIKKALNYFGALAVLCINGCAHLDRARVHVRVLRPKPHEHQALLPKNVNLCLQADG